jgi:hypothetical protein
LIPLEYLKKCHNYHNIWLNNSSNLLTKINVDKNFTSFNQNQTKEWLYHFKSILDKINYFMNSKNSNSKNSNDEYLNILSIGC